jgi:hypothetical protein
MHKEFGGERRMWEYDNKMDLEEMECDDKGRGADGNGSGSCPIAGFDISDVEYSGSAVTVLVSLLLLT